MEQLLQCLQWQAWRNHPAGRTTIQHATSKACQKCFLQMEKFTLSLHVSDACHILRMLPGGIFFSQTTDVDKQNIVDPISNRSRRREDTEKRSWHICSFDVVHYVDLRMSRNITMQPSVGRKTFRIFMNQYCHPSNCEEVSGLLQVISLVHILFLGWEKSRSKAETYGWDNGNIQDKMKQEGFSWPTSWARRQKLLDSDLQEHLSKFNSNTRTPPKHESFPMTT